MRLPARGALKAYSELEFRPITACNSSLVLPLLSPLIAREIEQNR